MALDGARWTSPTLIAVCRASEVPTHTLTHTLTSSADKWPNKSTAGDVMFARSYQRGVSRGPAHMPVYTILGPFFPFTHVITRLPTFAAVKHVGSANHNRDNGESKCERVGWQLLAAAAAAA